MEEYSEKQMMAQRTVYESMRLQTFFLINIQLSQKDRMKEVTKLMSFPWDKEQKKEVKTQSVEEVKTVLKNIVQAFKK